MFEANGCILKACWDLLAHEASLELVERTSIADRDLGYQDTPAGIGVFGELARICRHVALVNKQLAILGFDLNTIFHGSRSALLASKQTEVRWAISTETSAGHEISSEYEPI